MNKKQTVGQVVLENPQVIEVFSNLGIDFCCGGEMTIEEAAKDINLDTDKLIEKIMGVEKKENGEIEDAISLNSKDLIEYIIDYHHKNEIDLLNEIDPLLQKILRVHYKNHGKELSEIYGLFTRIKGAMLPHFYKEEALDFPNYLSGIRMDLEGLLEEHDEVGSLVDSLEDKTMGFTPPKDACPSYQLAFDKLKALAADIHKHVFLENQVLFKRDIL